MGFNTAAPGAHLSRNWVSDLMLECDAEVSEPGSEFWLGLGKGADRFLARFDLATGQCTLTVQPEANGEGRAIQLATQPTNLKEPGRYHLRFANVDHRLLLWVNDELPFGEGKEHTPSSPRPVEANDLKHAAAVGARGATVRVEHLKVWRDTYYTAEGASPDVSLAEADWTNPKAWGRCDDLPVRTTYVQPGHYFFLGDNSTQSSDGRYWGLVPASHILGPALLTYWPQDHVGTLR